MANFRVRARTVDLLGRQQIANISTAISELFKNAHDAYANNVEVDYFRDDGLFVLRDDGLGMTREDFEQRWLTLGTDSKLGGKSGLKQPPVDPAQALRPTLGEKGIGRLAIAVIGRQVLVLTRAKRDGKAAATITAAYIHWGLFELPGIDIDEIVIPIEEFKADALPNEDDVQKLVDLARTALIEIQAKVEAKALKTLRDEMKNFKCDPYAAHEYLKEPSFSGDGCGTHFYIQPADEILKDDIDTREDGGKSTRLEKNLIGFTNTMTPTSKPPKIITQFRDHVHEGEAIERVGTKTFFTPEEFREVDHHITGRFDEFGQFRGEIGVYQTEPDDYVLNWNNSSGKPTLCGPFSFSLAILQGTQSDTLLDPIEFTRMREKLDRHGGLYVYKNGIRVQPYGDSGHDFLDIERRRTLSASYYYYSFRRIFGAVELDTEFNDNLKEKAGREGFREDKAYRQFRSILMNFFIQSAADYFRVDGNYVEAWENKRTELQRNAQILKDLAKKSKTKKAEFEQKLEVFFGAFDQDQLATEVHAGMSEFEDRAAKIASGKKPIHDKSLALLAVERDANEFLVGLKKKHTITKPRGVGLSRKLTNDWVSYQEVFERAVGKTFAPAAEQMENSISSLVSQHKLILSSVERINAKVRARAKQVRSEISTLRTDVDGAASSVGVQVKDSSLASFRAVQKVVDQAEVDLEHLKSDGLGGVDLVDQRDAIVEELDEVISQESEKLNNLKDQLNSLIEGWVSSDYDSLDLTEALEEEVIALRERRNSELELAQIGLAINTINHEFEKTVSGLRDGFSRLKSWSNENPELERLYKDMRDNFDHLDGYLSLFTPLDRRLQRTAIDISGREIFDFVSGLFEARLERHSVTLSATTSFKKAMVHGFPSDFFPVFVNLIDNSIFWLQRKQGQSREVTLDAQGEAFLVRDNGPGVSARDRLNIFELNFSRKPGGRGMGLHISRVSLAKIGFNLTLDELKPGNGAVFRIAPKH
jgi:signal transduction histidine kinase